MSILIIVTILITFRLCKKQGITDLANILVNGKDANWDDEDPLPFLAAHLLPLPRLFWQVFGRGEGQLSNKSSKKEYVETLVRNHPQDIL